MGSSTNHYLAFIFFIWAVFFSKHKPYLATWPSMNAYELGTAAQPSRVRKTAKKSQVGPGTKLWVVALWEEMSKIKNSGSKRITLGEDLNLFVSGAGGEAKLC